MAEIGRLKELSSKQKRGVQALLTCPTIQMAAEKVGVGERTIRRWLKQSAFRAALNDAQDEALTVATSQLAESLSAALVVLKHIAIQDKYPASARVSAARTITENALKFKELLSLAERVAALEEALEEQRRERRYELAKKN